MCNHNESPLQGEDIYWRRRPYPTFSIGLISVAPSELGRVAGGLLVSLMILAGAVTSCSKRVEYDRSTLVATRSTGININTASADDFDKLPNIGGKTAENIIRFRTENGPFRRVEHLMLIRGISEERFLEFRPFIKTE